MQNADLDRVVGGLGGQRRDETKGKPGRASKPATRLWSR